MQQARIWDSLGSFLRNVEGKGERMGMGVTLLQMLAWASLSDREGDIPNFTDTELTAEQWPGLLIKLQKHLPENPNLVLAFEPVEGSPLRRVEELYQKLKGVLSKNRGASRSLEGWVALLSKIRLFSRADVDTQEDLPITLTWMALVLAQASYRVLLKEIHPLFQQIVMLGGITLNCDANLSTTDNAFDSHPDFCLSMVSSGMQKHRQSSFREGQNLLPLLQSADKTLLLVDGIFLKKKNVRAFIGSDIQVDREDLVSAGILQSVIGLPNIMPRSFPLYLCVITECDPADKPDTVLFIDASQSSTVGKDIVHILKTPGSIPAGFRHQSASIREIEKNGFDLAVERYVISENAKKYYDLIHKKDEQVVPLEDVAHVINPQYIKTMENIPQDCEGIDHNQVREVTGEDISELRIVSNPERMVYVVAKGLSKFKEQYLKTGDILISIKSNIGKLGIVEMPESPSEGVSWLPNQSFAIIRLRQTSPIKYPIVLVEYLSSLPVQEVLNSYAMGAHVPLVPMDALRKLQVIIPSADIQESIHQSWHRMRELSREINELKSNMWPHSLFNPTN